MVGVIMFSTESKKTYGVYRIVSPSGKCYIGMTTKSFANRWNEHYRLIKSGRHHCKGLQQAFLKYGIENMLFEILEDMTGYGQEEILYRERQWWLKHRAWIITYNGEPSGFGSVKHTQETKDKIRDAKTKSLLEKGWIAPKENECKLCGKAFIPKYNNSNQKFCSRSCATKNTNHSRGINLDKKEFEEIYTQSQGNFEVLGRLLGRTSRTAYELTLKYDLREKRKLAPIEKSCLICKNNFPYKKDKKACSEGCSKILKKKQLHNRWHKNRNITKNDCELCL